MDNKIMDSEIMNTAGGSNMEQAGVGTHIPNPATLVPVEEHAVEQEDMEETGLAIATPIAVVSITTPAELIPEEEREVEDNAMAEYADAEKNGFFSYAVGMAQIRNVLDGKLYTMIRAESDGRRFIEFCQRYEDGHFSPKVIVDQADLLFASMYKFMTKSIPIAKMKTKLGNFLTNVTNDYLGKFDGDEPLDIVEILNALLAARKMLPVCMDEQDKLPPEKFYVQVMNAMHERFRGDFLDSYAHKAYYAFGDCEISGLAEELGTSKAKLLKQLKEYHFLYLTPSSKGYQTKVRYEKDKIDDAYCIYRMEYIGAQFNSKD